MMPMLRVLVQQAMDGAIRVFLERPLSLLKGECRVLAQRLKVITAVESLFGAALAVREPDHTSPLSSSAIATSFAQRRRWNSRHDHGTGGMISHD